MIVPSSTDSSEGDLASPDELLLDRRNPRLVEYAGTEEASQLDLLRALWQHMAVEEVALSIAASGFWPHERLFVVEEGDGQVVVEGNRRLAAVQLLRSPELRTQLKATGLPSPSPEVADSLEALPIVRTTREQVWQYIGFKHVNGPAKWGSYPKAQYIWRVKTEFGVSLTEIASQIGDTNLTVQRLFRALCVVQQAEDAGVYSREHRYRPHFNFSHLYVGLGYSGIQQFLNLTEETAESDTPVPESNLASLSELCLWLWGDSRSDTPPIVQSQNPDLRNLAGALESESAISALRSGLPLSIALDIGKGDQRVFREALDEGKRALQKAQSTMSTGFDGERPLLELAGDVQDIATDLVDAMANRARKLRKRLAENGVEEERGE